MDAIAQLGMRIDAQGVTASWQQLDRMSASSLAAQKATEALTRASALSTAQARDRVAAEIAAYRQTLQTLQGEQQLESARIKAQISEKGRADAINRSAQLARESQAVTKALAQLERDLTVATDASTAAMQRNARAAADLRTGQAASGSAQAQAYQTALNGNLGVNTGTGGPGRAADVQAYGAALDQLRAKFNPLFAASKQYEMALEEIAVAERQGAITEHESAQARESARLGFERVATGANSAGRAFGNTTGSLTQLSFQINDIASGIAMGQSPFTILAQQGGQVFQVWQMNPGIFKDLGGFLSKAINPATLLAGGILAIGGALAYAYSHAIQTEKALEAALVGPGRAAGVTAAQLDGMAQSAAASSDITVGSARSIAEAYASSGALTGKSIGALTALTADYAATTHQSMGDATKNLVQDFGNLSTGIDDLAKRLGGITPAQETNIRNLLASGSAAGAARAAIDAMNPSLAKHNENLTAMDRLWASIERRWSNASAKAGAALNPGIDAELKAAQAILDRLKDAGFDATAIRDQQDIVDKLLAKQRQGQQKATADAAASAANTLATSAKPDLGSLFPMSANLGGDYTDLANLQKRWQAISQNTAAQNALGISADQAAAALAIVNDRVAGYLSPAQAAYKQSQLDIAALYARTPAEKAAVAGRQVALQLAGQSVSIGEKEARIAGAKAAAYAGAAYQLKIQNDQTDAAIQGNINLAKAYALGDAAARESQAQTQARIKGISTGIDELAEARRILALSVSQNVAQTAADFAGQQRLITATKAANDNVASGALAYDRLNDAIQANVKLAELQADRQNAVNLGNKEQIALIDEQIAKLPELVKHQQALADQAARLAALNPNASDIRLIQSLQAGMASGSINRQAGTAALGQVSLVQSNNQLATGLGQGNPFGISGKVAQKAMLSQDAQQEAQQLQNSWDAYQSGAIKSWQDYQDQRVAIQQAASLKMKQDASALGEAQLAMMSTAFGGLADSIGQLTGKSGAAYESIFAISKAFAIAQASLNMQVAISYALATPFPDNLAAWATVAADGAQIISSIASIVAPGLASGAVGIQRQGGNSGDTAFAFLTPGESVMNVRATNDNRNTLAAMNAGAKFDGMGYGGSEVITVAPVFNIDARGAQQGVGAEIKKQLAEVAPAIVSAAVASAKKQSANWVASANKTPRKRA